ncbi:hypothetical protein SVI_0675 [Shewanella violacea DSS12]|uniref:Uncharacterized protein n=1 Tax=Shewanella violacea (strain JCM 10179 / CIP 106290 / LMG 19151 / DSS12) TaxID=637905 RepID=D4ZG47_SHEVD|nr:hypothetical protein SVI_0675 [Shewanella violacea DSS12]
MNAPVYIAKVKLTTVKHKPVNTTLKVIWRSGALVSKLRAVNKLSNCQENKARPSAQPIAPIYDVSL